MGSKWHQVKVYSTSSLRKRPEFPHPVFESVGLVQMEEQMFRSITSKMTLGALIASALLLPAAANATIVFEYSQTPQVDVFQQTTNNPCVIGDPSCEEPSGMFYDRNSGSPGSTYDLYSTVYLAAASNNF